MLYFNYYFDVLFGFNFRLQPVDSEEEKLKLDITLTNARNDKVFGNIRYVLLTPAAIQIKKRLSLFVLQNNINYSASLCSRRKKKELLNPTQSVYTAPSA